MLSTAHFLRSALPLAISQLITWGCTALLVIILPRHLGDVNLGKLGLAVALTNLIAPLADFGAASWITREAAKNPKATGALTANTLVLRLPLAAVAVIVTVIAVNVAGFDDRTKSIVYILCPYFLFDAIGKVVLGALQGLQNMRFLALGSTAGKVVFALLALGLVVTNTGGPVEVAALYLISSFPLLGVAVFALIRSGRLAFSVDWRTWRAIFLGGAPFFVWTASLAVYGQIDVLILSFLSNDAVVGWYGAAYKIVMLPVFVPTIIMTVAFPALAAAASDHPTYSAIARRALRSVVLLSVPLVIGVMLLAQSFIILFGYPDTFMNSVPLIAILAPCLLLSSVDTLIGTVLSTRDRQRHWAVTGLFAAVLNPLLNLIAIPYTQSTFGNGAMGAAAVTTLTEVFMLVVGLRLIPAGVFDRGSLVHGAKCLAVGLIMGVFVWLTRDYPIFVPIALGGLVYGAGCFAVGTLSVGELRELVGQIAARARPAVDARPGEAGA